MGIKNPLRTKAAAAALIFFLSDSVTQYLTNSENNDNNLCEDTRLSNLFSSYFSFYDPNRAASGAIFGAIATGWLHYWWGFLEVVVARRFPVETKRFTNTMTKVVLDQGIG